jgi:rhamnosyltransferase
MIEPPASGAEAPAVSILFVVKNERKNLERMFPMLLAQDYSGAVEYICVDSGSTDGTVAFLREHGAVIREIPPAEFHHGRTRNLAASLASGEILVMLSGDAFPANEQWLRKLAGHFADPKVGAVYGKQTAPAGMGALRAQSLGSEYSEMRQVRDPKAITRYNPGHFRFSNANGAVRRELWARFRWNEELLLAEDQGMCRDILMAGYQVIYEPEAEVIHGHERSLWCEFKFALDNGLSLSRLGILNNPEVGGELRYGLARMKTDLTHFAKRGRIDCVALSLISFAARYAGVQIGKREKKLPHWFLRRVSEVHEKMRL